MPDDAALRDRAERTKAALEAQAAERRVEVSKRLTCVWAARPRVRTAAAGAAAATASFSPPSPTTLAQARARRDRALAHAAASAAAAPSDRPALTAAFEARERELLRSARRRWSSADFETLAVIGRGAFGEVRGLLACVRCARPQLPLSPPSERRHRTAHRR